MLAICLQPPAKSDAVLDLTHIRDILHFTVEQKLKRKSLGFYHCLGRSACPLCDGIKGWLFKNCVFQQNLQLLKSGASRGEKGWILCFLLKKKQTRSQVKAGRPASGATHQCGHMTGWVISGKTPLQNKTKKNNHEVQATTKKLRVTVKKSLTKRPKKTAITHRLCVFGDD